MERKKRPIEIGWLTINQSCNNRCAWCYAQEGDFASKDMPFPLAEKLVDIYSSIGVEQVVLIGGEPTLYPRLFDLTRMMIKKGVEPMLISNGRKFSDENFTKQLLDTGITKIGMSAKAANKEQYLLLTKRDGYDEFIKGYQNLKKLIKNINVSLVLVEDILPVLPEMLSNLIKEGIDDISVDVGSPVILNNSVSAEGIIDPQKAVEGIIQAYEFLGDKKVKFNFHSNSPLCLFPAEIKDKMIEQKKLSTCCHVSTSTGLIFDQEGNVLPCSHFVNHALGKFEVDFKNGAEFVDFWYSDKVEEFRTAYHNFPSEKCANCSDWAICGGGCIMNWLHWNPSLFIKGKEVKV